MDRSNGPLSPPKAAGQPSRREALFIPDFVQKVGHQNCRAIFDRIRARLRSNESRRALRLNHYYAKNCPDQPDGDFFNTIGRVGTWRGGGRPGMSVSAPFV